MARFRTHPARPPRFSDAQKEWVYRRWKAQADAHGLPLERLGPTDLCRAESHIDGGVRKQHLKDVGGGSMTKAHHQCIGWWRAFGDLIPDLELRDDDDEEEQTQVEAAPPHLQAYVPGPVESVPEGFHVDRAQTLLGPDGEVRAQTIRARPEPQQVVPQAPVVPKGHDVRGVSSYLDSKGAVYGQWVKTDRVITRAMALARLQAEIWANLRDRITTRTVTVPSPAPGLHPDLCTVYPIGDAHIGMRAWQKETGATGGNYDLKIASRLMKGAFDVLTAAPPRAHTGVVIDLGDFTHNDNAKNQTPRGGNPLDVDGRLALIIETAVELLIYACDRALEAHEEVHLVVVRGNHNPTLAFPCALAVERHFAHEPRLTVHKPYGSWWFWRFGACLLAATHGDGKKQNAQGIPLRMSAEVRRRPDLEGTRHWHAMHGHVHHHGLTEAADGTKVEHFQTLAPVDGYAAAEGYVGGRSLHRVTFHREHGEVYRTQVSADAIEALLGRIEG